MKNLLLPSCLILFLAACNTQTSEPIVEVETPPTIIAATDSESVVLPLPLPATSSPDITEEDLALRISTLADDAFEGRGPGAEKGELAADWIAQEFKRIGAEPAVGESYFQTVQMVSQTVDEGLSTLTISSNEEKAPFILREEAVIWTKRQNELDLSFDESDVVFVGYGSIAPEYGWNDYAGLDVQGKTVIMLVNDPGFATKDPDLFNGNAMTYYGRWTYKFEEAARQGATAAIVIHETEPASYGWDVVRNSWSGGQADLVRKGGGADRVLMEGWISRDTALAMFEDAGLDFEALKLAAAKPGFKPVPMGDLKAKGRIVQTIQRATSRNVIAKVTGTEEPDEYVLYTAHWDHLGKAESPADEKNFTFQEDKIYNGAVDNATGTAALIEIVEKVAANPPKRSALFAAVTLEESGLLGSAYLAENPVIPSKQIVAGLNMDGILPLGPSKNMVVVGYGASELEDILSDVLSEKDRTITPDPVPQNGFFYRSDHISFAKKGIPMLYADGGNDVVEGGIAAGTAAAKDYTVFRYHKPQDEYSEDWDLSGMVEDISALYETGARVANSSDWPTWYEGNEFEAIRKLDLASDE